MIIGKIESNLDARIPLALLVGDARHEVVFVLDTGFNGYLAISMSLVDQLDMRLGEVQSGITADGRSGFFDTVRVIIDWHGNPRSVQAQVLDEPLIGTRLLNGNKLEADWKVGSKLVITKLA